MTGQSNGDGEVMRSLPRTRPQRRSAKRDAPADGPATKPKKAAAQRKPPSAAAKKAAPKAKAAAPPPPPPAGYASPRDGGDRTGDLVATGIRAVGELAGIGLTVGRQVFGRTLRRLLP